MIKHLNYYILISFFLNIIRPQKVYVHYSFDEILNIFQNLSHSCSHYVRIDSSQKRYNLDSVDGCGKNKNCTNLIVYMTDFDTYTLDRPAYYISGLLHGDEVIGPTSITEFVKYFCDTYDENKNSLYHNILKNRIIIMTPMTNAFGYYNKKREEKVYITKTKDYKLIDPNRDFPYFQSSDDYHNCMQTIAARTINEIFNEFIIGGAITFHGGDSVLGYAWGNFIHMIRKNKINVSTESPDYNAFNNIGKIMVNASSSQDNLDKNIKDYVLGDITSTIYPLNGALEDWVYAGWENKVNEKLGINSKPIKDCKPDSFNEYYMSWDNLKNNSDYDDYKLRCLMFLAEASLKKMPEIKEYGNKIYKSDIFDFYGTTNFYGHVPRNMRLMYSGIDLISASIFLDVNNINQNIYKNKNQIIIPFLFMGCLSLKKYSIHKINFENISKKIFEKNYLEDNSNSETIISEINEGINCYFNNLTYYNLVIEIQNENNTSLERNLQSSNNSGNNVDQFIRPGGNYDYLGNVLNKKIITDKSFIQKGSLYFIKGEAPDQEWKYQDNPDPKVEPQSHVVRSKTNSSYYVKNGNYSLKSNYFFYSYPVVALSNGDIQIIDDIDSFFYEKELGNINLIINQIENNYKIVSQVFCIKKSNSYKNYLSSENSFEINLEMHIYENKRIKQKKITNETKEYEIVSHILLSDENDIFHLETLDCEFNNDISLQIKCNNILKNKNINGRFIRQKLANSILRFELKENKESFLDFFGQISLDKENKGKYYIDYYSNEDYKDNNKMICSSNFPNFITLRNESKKDNYYIDDIYYEITISKMSTRNLKLNIDIKQKGKKQYNYFIIFFPFNEKIEIFNLKKKTEIEINLDESINGKIIGKTVYIIPIDNKDNDNDIISKLSYNNNDIHSLIFSLNKMSKNKNYKFIPCSITSYNSFKNDNSLMEFMKMSEQFKKANPFIKKRKKSNIFKNIILLGIIAFIIGVIYNLIIKKFWSSSDAYSQFSAVSISDMNDYSSNRYYY